MRPSDTTATACFTIREVRGILKIGKTSVYNLIRRGELQSFRLGRARRITSASLQALIDGREAAARGSRTA